MPGLSQRIPRLLHQALFPPRPFRPARPLPPSLLPPPRHLHVVFSPPRQPRRVLHQTTVAPSPLCQPGRNRHGRSFCVQLAQAASELHGARAPVNRRRRLRLVKRYVKQPSKCLPYLQAVIQPFVASITDCWWTSCRSFQRRRDRPESDQCARLVSVGARGTATALPRERLESRQGLCRGYEQAELFHGGLFGPLVRDGKWQDRSRRASWQALLLTYSTTIARRL